MSTFKPGDRFHHWVVGRLLGTGAHGEVFEVTHEHSGAVFAMKTMHLANVGDARLVRRALAEARGAYGIDHANVLKVYDFACEEESGLVWMRTELLQGHTLAALVGLLGALSPGFAIAAAIEAAHGLAAAHEAQIVHRDVKPANLFYVRPTCSLRVIDFSIAKIFPEGLETTFGRAGLGTPAFMSPEQLDGAVPTPAFDVYALGLSLWQLLAGRHPFEHALASSKAITRCQYVEMPPLLADVAGLPPEVDAVVRRAVAKDPAARYPTMRAMAQALVDLGMWLANEVQAGRVVLYTPPGEPPPPGDARTRRDYAAPHAAPASDAPTPAPSQRVLIAALPAPVGLGGTVLMGARALPSPASVSGDTAPLAPAANMPPRAAVAPAAPVAPVAPREAERTVPSTAVAARRVSWRAAGLAAVIVSATTLGVVALTRPAAPVHRDLSPVAPTGEAPLIPAPSESTTPQPPPPLTMEPPPSSAAEPPRPPPSAPSTRSRSRDTPASRPSNSAVPVPPTASAPTPPSTHRPLFETEY
jgi:tRNA A-37 threonylcarbamoyl transferase component Bud32